MKPIIAIDGPAASGKGTMARMLAEHFHFAYLDSGSLYRAFACIELVLSDKPNVLFDDKTVKAKPVNVHLSDLCKDYDFLRVLSDILKETEAKKRKIDFSSYITHKDFFSEDVSGAHEFISIAKKIPVNILKSEIVGMGASTIGKLPEVRALLNSLMREFANSPGDDYLGTVIDGRDIGTVVFPNATCKIFLTADLKVRAERRFKDAKDFGDTSATFESIYETLRSRDERDASRSIAPMTYDETYIVVDTSNINIQEVFKKLVNIIDLRLHNA